MIYSKHLQRLRECLVRNGQSERGTTLIEMMVVISIISILSLGTVYLMGAQFNSMILGAQALAQQSTTSTTSSFISTRLAGTIEVGSTEGPTVAPASIAGDQFFAKTSNDCVRVFYVEHSIDTGNAQMRAAWAPLDECDSIRPVRGPNQLVDPHEGCAAPCTHADPEDGFYDQVLDNPEKSIVLVEYASLQGGGANVTEENKPFTYLDADNEPLTDFPTKADSSQYQSLPATSLAKVKGILITLGIGGTAPDTTPSVSARQWTQTIYVN